MAELTIRVSDEFAAALKAEFESAVEGGVEKDDALFQFSSKVAEALVSDQASVSESRLGIELVEGELKVIIPEDTAEADLPGKGESDPPAKEEGGEKGSEGSEDNKD